MHKVIQRQFLGGTSYLAEEGQLAALQEIVNLSLSEMHSGEVDSVRSVEGEQLESGDSPGSKPAEQPAEVMVTEEQPDLQQTGVTFEITEETGKQQAEEAQTGELPASAAAQSSAGTDETAGAELAGQQQTDLTPETLQESTTGAEEAPFGDTLSAAIWYYWPNGSFKTANN